MDTYSLGMSKIFQKKETRRSELIPVITQAFVDLGYNRATTAELARRCELRENELYRLWDSKKSMFISAIQCIYAGTMSEWESLAKSRGNESLAEKIISYQAANHGKAGFFRIIFAGLQEVNDPEIKSALREMYQQFHSTFVTLILEHHGESDAKTADEAVAEAKLVAWALIGIGAIADIDRSINLTSATQRKRLINGVGRDLLEMLA